MASPDAELKPLLDDDDVLPLVLVLVVEALQLLDDDDVLVCDVDGVEVVPLGDELDVLAPPVDEAPLPPPWPPDWRVVLLVALMPPEPPPPQFSWSGCWGQARFAGTKPPIPSHPARSPIVATAMMCFLTIPP